MGNWHITIQGTGGHSNGQEGDADVVGRKLVETLQTSGQHVDRAVFHSDDGREEVLHPLPAAEESSTDPSDPGSDSTAASDPDAGNGTGTEPPPDQP